MQRGRLIQRTGKGLRFLQRTARAWQRKDKLVRKQRPQSLPGLSCREAKDFQLAFCSLSASSDDTPSQPVQCKVALRIRQSEGAPCWSDGVKRRDAATKSQGGSIERMETVCWEMPGWDPQSSFRSSAAGSCFF